MGNDITPPDDLGAASLRPTDGRERAIPIEEINSLAPAPLGHDAPPLPRTGFEEVQRFRDVDPLDAARGWARQALTTADRARWESGVARQAERRGNHEFAVEVLGAAQRHASAARFLEGLATSALTSWISERSGRHTSLGTRQLLARVRREVSEAERYVGEALRRIPHEPGPASPLRIASPARTDEGTIFDPRD